MKPPNPDCQNCDGKGFVTRMGSEPWLCECEKPEPIKRDPEMDTLLELYVW